MKYYNITKKKEDAHLLIGLLVIEIILFILFLENLIQKILVKNRIGIIVFLGILFLWLIIIVRDSINIINTYIKIRKK